MREKPKQHKPVFAMHASVGTAARPGMRPNESGEMQRVSRKTYDAHTPRCTIILLCYARTLGF